jgi:hypothetical protein
MNNQMKEITVTGIISRMIDKYVITTDDWIEYKLFAIMSLVVVVSDFDSEGN